MNTFVYTFLHPCPTSPSGKLLKACLIKGDLCVVVAVVWPYFIADPLSTQAMKTPLNFIRGVTLACVHHLYKSRG